MPRVRKVEKEPSTEDVLNMLGVDGDLEPEDAALEHAARTQAAFDDDDSGVLQLPPNPRPKPAARKPSAKKAAAASSTEAAPEPEPSDPLPYTPMPAPTPIRPQARNKSPSVGRMGKGLAALVPGAEEIKIKKRLDNGKLGHVGTFNIEDFRGCKDIEDFLHKYVTRKFGFGEYEAIGRDAQGRDIPMGSVTLLGSPDEGRSSDGLGGVTSLMQSMMVQQQEMYREAMERAEKGRGAEMNPVTMLKDVMEVSNMASQDSKKEKERMEAMAAESGNMMMQMMMFMSQQQQASQERMMMLLAPKEDSEVKQLLKKLVEKSESSSSSSAIPPPPPPADPMDGMAKLLGAMAAMMTPLLAHVGGGGGGGGGDEDYKAMLKEMVAARDQERLTPKDMLSLMSEMRQERGTDDFKKSADNLAMMMTLATQMRNSTEGSSSAGVWDALASLFGNRDFAGSIAQRIRSKASESHAQIQADQQQQQAILQQRALLAQQQHFERQRMAAQAQSALQQQQAAVAQPQTAPTPTAQPAPAPAAQPPAPPAVQAAAPHIQAVPPPQPPVQKIQLPPLPSNTTDYINEIVQAKDEAGLVQHTVMLLQYLGEFAEWRPFVTDVLTAAQSGDKRQTMQYLAVLFEGFIGIGLIELPMAQQVLKAATKYFDDIHHTISDDGTGTSILPEEDEEPEGLDYMATFEDAEDEEEPNAP